MVFQLIYYKMEGHVKVFTVIEFILVFVLIYLFILDRDACLIFYFYFILFYFFVIFVCELHTFLKKLLRIYRRTDKFCF